MTQRILLSFLALHLYTLQAQDKSKDISPNFVSKGTFFVGLTSGLPFGYAFSERRFISPMQLQPRIGYFISDRLSLGLSYQGSGISSSIMPRYMMYHKGLIELNYYFYTGKNLLLYSQTGLSFEQYGHLSYYYRKATTVNLKVGAGISWRLKKAPNIALNMEAAYYLSPGAKSQKFPNITFGVSYFFNRKKPANKKSISF